MRRPSIEIEQIAYHRNGVSGEGFFAVTFIDLDEATKMLGVCFFEWTGQWRNYPDPRVSVLNRELVGAGEIRFGYNSWRGDRYCEILLAACQAWEDTRGVVDS